MTSSAVFTVLKIYNAGEKYLEGILYVAVAGTQAICRGDFVQCGFGCYFYRVNSCIGKDLLGSVFDLGKYIFPKPILWSTINLNLKLVLFLYVVFKLFACSYIFWAIMITNLLGKV